MLPTYFDQTTLHPVGVLLTAVLGVLVLILPRRYVVVPLLLLACFMAPAQRLVILGADFTPLRIGVLLGLLRWAMGGERWFLRWCALDTLLLVLTLVSSAVYVIQWGTFGALMNRLGAGVDGFGAYLLFRVVIRDIDDFTAMAEALAWISLPVAAAFVFEYATHRNLFAALGGVQPRTWVRDGHLRCQGAFAHPIFAGCFFAGVLPIVIAWARAMSRPLLGGAAVIACLLIIVASGSSTPLVGIAVAIAGWVVWHARRWIGWVVVGATAVAALAALVSEGPVWDIFRRVNILTGSTGLHRARLLDAAYRHLDEWWLLGVRSTTHWGQGLWDITNQYLLEGVRGGVISMVLFTSAIVLALVMVARQVRAAAPWPRVQIMGWGLGLAILVHASCFMAVSYYGQIVLLWQLTLAAVPGLGAATIAARHRAAHAPRVGAGERSRPLLVTS